MLRKRSLVLLTFGAIGLMLPTMSVARAGKENPQREVAASGLRDDGHGLAHGQRDFGGDARFRIGTNYGSQPYDYSYQDYNFYAYPYARGVQHVNRR